MLACLAGVQVLSLVHLVAVPHVRCAVHDELVHAADGHAGHAHLGAEPAARTDGPRWSEAGDGAHDEHCEVLWLLRQGPSAVVQEWTRAHVPTARARGEVLEPSPARAPGFPLYLLAPKASPPELG